MVLYLLFRDRKSQESTCISKPERFYNQLARLFAKRGKKDFSMKIQVICWSLNWLLIVLDILCSTVPLEHWVIFQWDFKGQR